MPGTEQILRNACTIQKLPDEQYLRGKETTVPWLLDVDFENNLVSAVNI